MAELIFIVSVNTNVQVGTLTLVRFILKFDSGNNVDLQESSSHEETSLEKQ